MPYTNRYQSLEFNTKLRAKNVHQITRTLISTKTVQADDLSKILLTEQLVSDVKHRANTEDDINKSLLFDETFYGGSSVTSMKQVENDSTPNGNGNDGKDPNYEFWSDIKEHFHDQSNDDLLSAFVGNVYPNPHSHLFERDHLRVTAWYQVNTN